uniref:Sushi domain-containing protein n=1 Tax=Angiostrongylus cantonensis TaxID=6313 RepID=A0A0K0CVZ7_ANGCA
MKYFYIYVFLSSTLACQYKGRTYKNGDEWDENENFRMRCKIEPNGSWRTEVAACIAPGRTVVPVNQERDLGDYTWECKTSGNGQVVLRQRLSDRASCNGHPYGSQWTERSFQFRCGERGVTEFIGCIASSGTLIPNGEVKSVNGFDMECRKHANGTVAMGVLGRSHDAKCKDNEGRERNQGEKWIENNYFEKTCKERGRVEISGCRVDSVNYLIPVNGVASAGNLEYQ